MTCFFQRVAWLALLLWVSAGAGAAGTQARLEAFLGRVETLQAEFSQRLFDEQGRPIESSAGRFYLARPDRFRWSYHEPYAQEIVADGSRVWMYDGELEQVTVRGLDDALGSSPARLLSSEAPVGEAFEIRELGDQDGLHWVELRPRDAESTFSALRIGFDGATLRRMELQDNFGQNTQLTFEAVEENPALAPETFRFTPPAGVDVIRERD
ncbi:MAG: outer membrane lipoprotein chaperone LolA [Gammaproteobacteria bacterium]|nr:outer membrane lipoprotein chaperone LolA [Gammaproteobacteria bacterium]